MGNPEIPPVIYFYLTTKGGINMEKSRFMKALKEAGITKHPITKRSLKHSKTTELANLYFKYVEKDSK